MMDYQLDALADYKMLKPMVPKIAYLITRKCYTWNQSDNKVSIKSVDFSDLTDIDRSFPDVHRALMVLSRLGYVELIHSWKSSILYRDTNKATDIIIPILPKIMYLADIYAYLKCGIINKLIYKIYGSCYNEVCTECEKHFDMNSIKFDSNNVSDDGDGSVTVAVINDTIEDMFLYRDALMDHQHIRCDGDVGLYMIPEIVANT